MHGGSLTLVSEDARDGIANRWPHIRRFLHIGSRRDHDFHHWWCIEKRLTPEERAAGNEEWADYFEWRFEQRADELANDRTRRHLAAEWTESMAYHCRRAAVWARGDDPGEWLPMSVRRPDIHAEGQAIVDEITARMDEQSRCAGHRA